VAVIHVIESEGPGGAETVMTELVGRGGSTRRGTLAVIPSAGGWLGRTLPVAVQRIIRPSPSSASAPVDFAYLRALRRLFREQRPRLVHAHSFDSALYSALALRGLPARLVVTFHGASDVARHGLRNRVKWMALRRADAFICVSHSLANLARQSRGVPVDRVRTIFNGVDLSLFSDTRCQALRTTLHLDASTLLVGALGNVRAPKGYQFLLPAIAALRERGANIHLVIAGDERVPLADALREQRTSLGLNDCVTLLGFQSDSAAFLRGLDLFVLSSTSEGFSLSTVQAMASALPIVATRSGGPEELIANDVHGCLVAAGSSDALAEGIAALGADRARATRYAAAARTRAIELFSIETMVDAYDDLYRELAGL